MGVSFVEIMEDILLFVVKVGWVDVLVCKLGVRFYYWVFGVVEVDVVLFVFCDEEDLFDGFGGIGEGECVEEVGEYVVVDFLVFFFVVFLYVGCEEDVFV